MPRQWSDEWFAAEAATYGAVQDPRVNAVLDVLAPQHEVSERYPIFEWPHEETPTAEMIELAEQIVAALDAVPD